MLLGCGGPYLWGEKARAALLLDEGEEKLENDAQEAIVKDHSYESKRHVMIAMTSLVQKLLNSNTKEPLAQKCIQSRGSV